MTLNEIKEQLQQIATNHKQINSFGWGDIWEIATSGSIDYPMFWVKPENSVINGRVQTMNFTFIFMDLVANGEFNEDDALSEQLETAKDVIAQLQHPNYEWSYDAENSTLEPFTERFTDSVSGWTLTVGLDLPFSFDRCAMPYEGNTSSNSACPVVTILDSGGAVITTVSAGGTYTVTGGGAGGTINVYLDGVLQSSTSSTDLNAETVNILWT